MNPNYKVNMILNNNVILATNLSNNTEAVLLGKGLGFGLKKNLNVFIEDNKIERSFVNFSKTVKSEYYQLIQQMDVNVMGMCEEIIHMAEQELGELNDNIHIVLTDHIGFAIDRTRNKLEISNPFLFEIKLLYPDEFKIGKKAIEIINKEQNIELNEDEAAFIALHLHSSRKNTKVKETLKTTRIIKEIVELIEAELNITLADKGLNYRRLLTHIRGSIERVEKQIELENPLLEMIKDEFVNSWEIALKAKNIIRNELGLSVCDDETGYLTIHIDRLKRLIEK